MAVGGSLEDCVQRTRGGDDAVRQFQETSSVPSTAMISEIVRKISSAQRMAIALKPSPEARLLHTVPGVGAILAPLVWLEIRDVERFPAPRTWPALQGLCRGSSSAEDASGMAEPAASQPVSQVGFIEAATCAMWLLTAKATSDYSTIGSPLKGTWP